MSIYACFEFKSMIVCLFFLHTINRNSYEICRRTAEVLYGESSMRNGFGLRLLHKFLSLPFLQLQRETLTALLARNKRDTEVSSLELAEFLVNIVRFSVIVQLTLCWVYFSMAYFIFIFSSRAHPMPITIDFWKI